MTATASALKARAERAEAQRDKYQALMREAYAVAMPERDGWAGFAPGTNRQTRVFDSAAVVSVSRFANRLQQALFPSQQRWCLLGTANELGNDQAAQALQQQLERLTDLTFRHIHASNFDAEITAWSHDVAAGTAYLFIDNGRRARGAPRGPLLRVRAVPTAHAAFDEGPDGEADGIYWRHKLPARLVARAYPDADIPRELAVLAQDETEAEQSLLVATTFDPPNNNWAFTVLWNDHVLVRRSYRTNPWSVTRWTKAPGEIYGRGPLLQALPDIRTMNRLMELHLKSASFSVVPAFTARDDGILNPANLNLVPGAIIPVAENGGPRGASLAKLDMGGDVRLSDMMRQDLRTNVRQALMDDPLPPEITAGLTATEIVERMRRYQADTGVFGRLHTDAVVPIIRRCIDILEEAGVYAQAEIMDVMSALDEDLLRIQPSSPLARAQDLADVQAVVSFIRAAMAMGDAAPELLRRGISLSRAAPWMASRTGVPQQLIPTEEEARRQDEAEQRQAQDAMLAQSPAAAQVAGALANAATRMPEGVAPAGEQPA